jgi:hypothetical protein
MASGVTADSCQQQACVDRAAACTQSSLSTLSIIPVVVEPSSGPLGCGFGFPRAHKELISASPVAAALQATFI